MEVVETQGVATMGQAPSGLNGILRYSMNEGGLVSGYMKVDGEGCQYVEQVNILLEATMAGLCGHLRG